MELELQHTSLDGFQQILDRLLVQEETMEGIVPDIYPDIARIVDARGQAFLTSREPSLGNLRITGTVRTSVLYIPDGEDGPRQITLDLPFSCSLDDPGLSAACKVWALPRLNGVDARTINPRKVLIRAELLIELRVFAPDEEKICISAIDREDIGLQQRLTEQEIYIISAVNEKGISFSDVFALPSSRPNGSELLCSRVEQKSLDIKMIGGKLVTKGEAELVVIYRTVEGSAASARFDLPYSQVMELPGAGEDCEVNAEAVVTGLDCVMQQGEPATISATVEMQIHATAYEKKKITLLSDLYATSCALQPEWENSAFCSNLERKSKRASVRRFCESGIPAGTVVDATLAVGRVTAERDTEETICHADTAVTILFLSEDGTLCASTYPIHAEATITEVAENTSGWRCRRIGELIAVPVTGGIEVRFEIEFFNLLPMRIFSQYVSSVCILPVPEGNTERPSVVLRAISAGESLWDIAKAYQSTMGDIAAANDLEDGQITPGTMLLIPRRR